MDILRFRAFIIGAFCASLILSSCSSSEEENSLEQEMAQSQKSKVKVNGRKHADKNGKSLLLLSLAAESPLKAPSSAYLSADVIFLLIFFVSNPTRTAVLALSSRHINWHNK